MPRHFKRIALGTSAPPLCSWSPPHSRVTEVDVNLFLKHGSPAC